MLENLGCIVDLAINGQEAFDKVNYKDKKYDIILMDIQMPILNGYDTTKKIRSLPYNFAKEIPIIAFTANAFDEALKSRTNDHIAKPINMDELIICLKKNLSKVIK